MNLNSKVCGLDDGVDVVEPLGEEEAGEVNGRNIVKKPSRKEWNRDGTEQKRDSLMASKAFALAESL